jgi:mono/diheme cytochrome c family protein
MNNLTINRRQWKAPLFAGLLALFSFTSCGSSSSEELASPPGRKLFIGELCASCHGFERQGSWMGPPLLELAEHWDAPSLSSFIKDPSVFLKTDQRIRDLAKRFQANMTGNARLNDGDRLELAKWLLTPPPAQK